MTHHLCQLASDWRGDLPEHGIAFEEKVDGWRAMFMRGHDGEARLWTRNGRRIEGAGHIIHRLKLFERVAGQPLFIDGEFQVEGSLAETKRWCESLHKFGGTAGVFHAFDIVPMVNWVTGHWEKPWTYRKAWLAKLAGQVDQDPAFSWEWREGSYGADEESAVVVMPDAWAFDARDVLTEARRVWAAGGEGLVLKDPQAPYRRNRNDSWRKVKPAGPWQRALREVA